MSDSDDLDMLVYGILVAAVLIGLTVAIYYVMNRQGQPELMSIVRDDKGRIIEVSTMPIPKKT